MTTPIYLTPKQREAHNILKDNTLLLYGGGIQGGKSFFGLIELFLLSIKYPRSRWIAMRKSGPDLDRNLITSWNELANKGIGNYIKSFNQRTMVITFHNGSQIMFMAESFDTDKELNRFKGLQINGGLLDEVNELQEKTFYKIIERAGSWDGSPRCPIKLILTCNPTHNWVKTLIYDKWAKDELKEGWKFIPALITDNPYKPKEYIKSLTDNMPAHEYEVFVKGNWDVKLEGSLFDKDNMTFISTKEMEEIKSEAVLGYVDVADEGTDNLCSIMGYCINGKIYIKDVIYTTDNVDVTLPLCAAQILSHKANYVRIESNNQGSIFIKNLRKSVPSEKVLPVHNSTHKHTRILLQYAWINKYCVFTSDSPAESDYGKFMREILTYLKADENKVDDGADALSGLCKFASNFLPHLFK